MSEPVTPQSEHPQQATLVVPSRSPVVTYVLIGLNTLVFVLMVFSGISPVSPSAGSVLPWGADYGPLTTQGQWWRLFTSMFVHFGIIHIGMNMYVLYQIGPITERLFGRLRYLLLYVLAGLGGSVASLLIHPNAVGAGASGAIFGVYGGFLAFITTHRSVIPAGARQQIVRSAGIFLGINLLYGLKSNIDLSAHIFGLVCGFLFGLLLSATRTQRAA